MARSLLVSFVTSGAVIAALGGASGALLGLIGARRLTRPRPYEPKVQVESITDEQVSLRRTLDTSLPGEYRIVAPNSSLLLGDVLSSGKQSVTRQTSQRTGAGDSFTAGSWLWESAVFESPADLGGDVTVDEILVHGNHGDLPTWIVVPKRFAPSDTWAIHVHGHSSQRKQVLRGVSTFARLGINSMIIPYRNDGVGPSTQPRGHTLGVHESEDVDAAIDAARAAGATKVILVGWSMGAMIAFHAMLRNQSVVDGLVGISPVTSIKPLLRSGFTRVHLPGLLADISGAILKSSKMCRAASIAAPIDLDSLSWSRYSDDLDTPVLLIHSAGDKVMPFRFTHEFARQTPSATIVQTAPAPHTLEWNVDRASFEGGLEGWLIKVLSLPAPNQLS